MGNVLRDPKLNCVQLPGLVKKRLPQREPFLILSNCSFLRFDYSPSYGFGLAYPISFLPPAQQIGLELAPKNRMDPAYKSRPRRKIEPGPCKERVLNLIEFPPFLDHAVSSVWVSSPQDGSGAKRHPVQEKTISSEVSRTANDFLIIFPPFLQKPASLNHLHRIIFFSKNQSCFLIFVIYVKSLFLGLSHLIGPARQSRRSLQSPPARPAQSSR